MAAKKATLQLQIDTKFITNAKELAKQLTNSLGSIDLGKSLSASTSSLTKQLETELKQLSKGLNTSGLNGKEYTKLFNTISNDIDMTLSKLSGLRSSFQKMFNSESNQENLKELDKLKKKYEELLSLGQKESRTKKYLDNSIAKLESTTGSAYKGSNITSFKDIANRYHETRDDSKFTNKQKELLGIYDSQGKVLKGQEETLKRIVTYIDQISTHGASLTDIGEQTKNLTGNTTSPGFGAKTTSNQISGLEAKTLTIDELDKYKKKASEVRDTVALITAELSKGPGEIEKAEQSAQNLNTTMTTLKDMAAQFGLGFGVVQLARGFKDLVRYSFDFYKSLDAALNQIYVVSDLSSKAVNDLTTNFIGMAKRTGMSIDDVTTAAVIFYQQGLNTDAVMQMTEVTAQFAKVAGTDATDAADKLTAAVNGYCLAAEDAASVADKFNKVAAASAADIDELSTAFSKAAAQANQAGVSMDNYLAYIATMEEATREAPENIGTSLKTIFSRMQQIKTGENTEDDTDINNVETALKSVGIALRDTQGQLRDLEEIFDELGPKWNTLDRNTQAYIGTIVAGTRQQSRFITLMQNWDRVLELSQESENSAGMQALMHAEAMESLNSKVEQMGVAWQQFISNLTDSDTIKGLVDMITKLINQINKGRAPVVLLGGLISALSTKMAKVKVSVGDVRTVFNNFFGVVKKNKNTIKTYAQQMQALQISNKKLEDTNKDLSQSIINSQDAIDKATADMSNLQGQDAEAEATRQQLANTIDLESESIKNNSQKIIENNAMIDANKQKMTELNSTMASVATAVGGMVTLVTTIVGLLGEADSSTGQVIIAISEIVGAVVMATVAIKVACAGAKAALDSIGIGFILSAITLAVSGIKTLIDTINKDTEKVKKNGLNEAIESLSQGLDDIQGQAASIRATERLVARYQELQKYVALTASQQEEMNSIVQDLADSYDIETISDQYGNLSINIQEVNQALEEERNKLARLQEDLHEQETQAWLDAEKTGNSVDEYISRLYGTYSSDYKSLIEGLSTEYGNLSDNTLSSLNNYLKNTIMAHARELKTINVADYVDTFDKELQSKLSKRVSGSKTGYDQLYEFIEDLQTQVDGMSFAEVEEAENKFFEQFGDNIDLSVEEWKILVESINGTVFENDSLTNFLKQLRETEGILTGEKWTDKDTGLLNEKYASLKAKANQGADLNDFYEWSTGDATNDFYFDQDEINELIEKGYNAKEIMEETAEYVNGFGQGLWLFASNEGEKYLDDLKAEMDSYISLYKDFQNRMENFKVENGLEDWSNEDVQTLFNSINSLDALLSQTDSASSNFLAKSQELLEYKDVSATGYATIVQGLESVKDELDSFDTDAQRYAYLQEHLLSSILEDNPGLESEAREKIQDMLDEWFDGLSITANVSWKDFGKTVSNLEDNFHGIADVIEDLNDDGQMTLETFLKLCDALQDVWDNIDKIGALGQIDNLTAAVQGLNLAYNQNTDTITANGEAVDMLAQLQTVLVKAELAELQQKIQNNILTQEMAKIALQTEIDTTRNLIEALGTRTEATISSADWQAMANAEMTKQSMDDASQMSEMYKTLTEDTGQWSIASVSYVKAVADAMNKLATGETDWSSVEKTLNSISKGATWGGYSYTKSGGDDKVFDVAALKSNLTTYLGVLENNMKTVDNSIANYREMQLLIGQMMEDNDLSGLFGGGKGSGGSKSKIDEYIGKLEKIYNIENRILTLEHRLGTLESYSDIAQGRTAAEFFKEEIKVTDELLDQYRFLTQEQKRFTNGLQEDIKNAGFGNVFSFDKFGQIIINWEEYVKLEDKAADGQKSLKEQADEWYEKQTEYIEKTRDDFDKYIDTLEKALAAQNKIYDAYIEMENKAADAVKEIYQKILDTKLDAIDQEKEAIEELRKAREQDRKDQQNAKAVSNLQTNLQRAMMDTSGASDVAFIKAQNDMNDKLEEIAEDKYSRMLDDITQQLEDEKEALQEEFDELWENMDWLFGWLDDEVMRDEDRLTSLLQETEEWNTISNAERNRIAQEWDTNFQTYMVGLEGGKTIGDVWQNILDLQNKTVEMDNVLKDTISYTGTTIANALTSAVSKAYSSGYSAGGGGRTYNTGSLSLNNKTNKDGSIIDPTTTNDNSKKEVKDDTPKSAFNVGDRVKTKESGFMAAAKSYTWTGSSFKQNGMKYVSVAGPAIDYFTIGDKKYWDGKWWYQIGSGPDWYPGVGLTYKRGGFADYTGPAWLDGTKQHPEAVLNALQTEHFIKFTNALDKLYGNGNPTTNNSSINIESIAFNVDSMSSVEDGEKAFNMFVDKFKEIGNQTGIKINTFKNTL